MQYQDPYGLNPPDSPIADKVVRIYQSDNTVITRRPEGPDGQPCTPDNCWLEFTVVNRRFNTEVLYSADWVLGIKAGPRGAVEISIPSRNSRFERGSLLYSLTWYNILRSERRVLEEGSIMIEYSADAPSPDIPYNSGNPTREEQSNAF